MTKSSLRTLPLFAVLACAIALLPACGDDKTTTSGGTSSGGSSEGTPAAGGGTPAAAAATDHGLDDELRKAVDAAIAKGRAYLLTQQDAKGGFGDDTVEKMPASVPFTAMAVSALVAATPKTAVSKDEHIRKALAYLVGYQQDDGSIVDNPKWTNYCTAASVAALGNARIGDYRSNQSKAMAYLESSQIADASNEGSFGGFPYKDGQTADGSNAYLAADALESAGLAKDSVVRKRVGDFASGIQNRSESNTRELKMTTKDGEEITVVSGDDGGAIYRVGESKAGLAKRSDGRWELRSYGSMTYAVLKLMMFAGIPADDPRVQAIIGWIGNNWTLDRNPGFENSEDPEREGQQGLFYYYHAISKALSAYEKATGKPFVVRDADGRKHNWRAAVAKALLARQAENGSWRNPVDRWMEGMPTLATSFAVQTLGVLNGRLE